MQVLYISYDGMTDPLGQSQVLPYILSLAQSGFNITLISFEKEIPFLNGRKKISKILDESNIKWIPINYTKKPPVLSTLYDILKLKKQVTKLFNKNRFDIVHCRSYITSIIGLNCKKKYKSFFIFDMRGFWADERVDGKIWNLFNPIYSIIYGYFKRKEKQLLVHADHVVVLTHEAKKIITTGLSISTKPEQISVIPCSVDMQLFNYQNIDSAKMNTIKKELNISEEQFVLSYIGSIGTWYMLPEMLRFFSMLKQNKPNSIFLFVTKDNPDLIYDEAERQSLKKDDIIVVPSERNDIPNYINISHASIFFIKPCFSKKASSPTKQGELMSMGIPVICNSGIGDTDLIINETDSGILVHSFSDEEYKKAIDKIDDALKIPKVQSRKVAFKYYDLKIAANTYLEIYNRASKT